MLTKFFNISLRLANIGIRFLLTIYIAKFFSIEDLGIYGLLIAGVSFAIYPLGFEFYTYSTRELINTDKAKWGAKLCTQLFFHLFLYMLFLPIYFFIIQNTSLNDFVLYFILLVILEHANQELFRYHIIENDQLIGSCNVFIRQGIWGLAFLPISFVWEEYRNINSLLLFWAIGQCIALVFSLLNFILKSKIKFIIDFNWPWLKASFRTILPLFIATISLRALGSLDRFLFEHYGEAAQLSAYVFYIALASLVFTIADAGVFSFRYPELIKALNESEKAYFSVLKSMSIQVLFCCFISSTLIMTLSSWVVEWIGNVAIIEYSNMLIILLIAKNIQVLSMIPHYGMYAQKLDRKIMSINVLSFLVFILFVISFNSLGAIYSIPLGLCLAFLTMFLLKTFYCIINIDNTMVNNEAKVICK